MSRISAIQPQLPLPATDAAAPSFAEALALIEGWSDLPETRRRDLASGLRGAARLAGLPLAQLACCPERLNGVLFQRPAAAAGMSETRRRDVLALVRAVLRRLGRHSPQGTGERGLGHPWRDFLQALPNTPRRAGLRGFARWCDNHGITPTQVNDAALQQFVHDDRATRLAAATIDQGRHLAGAWRWATSCQPNRTAFAAISAMPRRQAYTLPFDAYPSGFQEDVQAFAARLSGTAYGTTTGERPRAQRFAAQAANPFRADAAPFRPVKPATVKARLFAIRQAAAALHLTGTPLHEIQGLLDLVHPITHAGKILDFFDERSGGKTGGQLLQIADTLRIIGRFCAHIPEHDRQQLRAWVKQAQGPRRGEMGAKARASILQLTNHHNRARLLHLPAALAREAANATLAPIEAARLMRSAVLIDLLLTCPLRLKDVQQLQVQSHFLHLDGNRTSASHLHVPAGSSKTDEPISWPLSASTRKLLRPWLAHHRATLAPAGSPYLFPGEGGAMLSMSALRAAFSQTIAQRIGLNLYPHAARHFAAYLYLNANPGEYETVRRILGHRSVETTTRFYCGLEADAAAKAFDAVLVRERAATRLMARPGRARVNRKGAAH